MYVLVLGLSAAAGWMSGLVLLPLVVWAVMEAVIGLFGRLPQPRRRRAVVG